MNHVVLHRHPIENALKLEPLKKYEHKVIDEIKQNICMSCPVNIYLLRYSEICVVHSDSSSSFGGLPGVGLRLSD